MKKWKEFLDINIPSSPQKMKIELQSIHGIKITNELYDPITDELHLNFIFQNYNFSVHNPYGGGYGYWFFFKIRKHNPEVTSKLKEILQNHFKDK
jgi:hypothetical protein